MELISDRIQQTYTFPMEGDLLFVLGIFLVVILVFFLVTSRRKRSEKYKPREELDEYKVWQGDTVVIRALLSLKSRVDFLLD